MLVSDLFGLISQLVFSATNLAEAASLWTSKEWTVVAHTCTLAWFTVASSLCF